MKKQFVYTRTIFVVIFTFLASCIFSQSIFPVRGHGLPVDKKYNVSDFKGINVSGGFDVILEQGDSESLILTAQENLFDYITVKVDNGILKIYTRNNLWSTKQMKAQITFKNISNLKVSGGGDVITRTSIDVERLTINMSGGGDFSSTINSDEVDCNISGGGDAEIRGNIKDYQLNISGGGDLETEVNTSVVSCRMSGGGDLFLRSREKVSDAVVGIYGGGDMEVRINADKLNCRVSGGGDALLYGQADEFEINLNGGGDINADDLATRITSFHVSGGSDVYVNVSEELTGYISGGGDVYYSGNPEKTFIDAKGGSEVHKK